MEKTKTNTTKAHIHQSKEKLKPGLVAFCDIQPGNEAGPFSKEKISKESEGKRISGEACDINKQTIYI